ncbi:Bug family tripartite tricarboxylate transporter substrate binding protein [Symbioplanes lichenis]|uniref:Bug family tripartite tricarboxylate transporter substrate binding protein n=1 Tax=Symbioplanes lichenis TaxID=1629072 RepID=UPI002739CAF6|nr:tripartite tricarboxylate transporter substrate binding protein [Actinoplanes lichenis]
MRRRVLLGGALGALAGCQGAPDGVRIMVPNPPGSGYDITARVLARELGVEVFNLPGGGGVVGLRRLAYERGNPRLLMLMGLGLIGAQRTADVTLLGTAPVARLVQEPAVVVVPRDSPYGSLDALVDAWRADPAAVPVGGGSSIGGPDHLVTMLVAEAAGITPSRVAYRRHDGGGDLLAALLGRELAFALSGPSEYAGQIASGQLRALAVTSADPVPLLGVPTVRAAGLNVTFTNWRGLVAPPGLTTADLADVRTTIAELARSPAWADACARFGWSPAYLDGTAFGPFIADETARVTTLLTRLGLA